MKIKYSDVREQQANIAEAFGASPRHQHVSRPKLQPRRAFKESFWRDVEDFFKSQKDLCGALDITAKTWRDIKSPEEGVREKTAKHVAIEFITLSNGLALGKIPTVAAYHNALAEGLNEKYGRYLVTREFDDLLVRVDPPPMLIREST